VAVRGANNREVPIVSYKIPSVFISYAWEDGINQWVRELASRLRSDGVDARIDQWDTVLGDQLTEYMEQSIRENDFVLIICTPTYKSKSDARRGGVGYEGHIITGEVLTKTNDRKFIPVLRKGHWMTSAPSFLISKRYADLRGKAWTTTNSYVDLLNTLHRQLEGPPPISTVRGTASRRTNTAVDPRDNLPSYVPRTRDGHSRQYAPRFELLNLGGTVLQSLEVSLRGLRRVEAANGATVFVDSDGLQRVKAYEYQSHCKVRVRCSRDWGFRNCKHRRADRNAAGWLDALRVQDVRSLENLMSLYNLEWGNSEP
jgi:hypothetical protein